MDHQTRQTETAPIDVEDLMPQVLPAIKEAGIGM